VLLCVFLNTCTHSISKARSYLRSVIYSYSLHVCLSCLSGTPYVCLVCLDSRTYVCNICPGALKHDCHICLEALTSSYVCQVFREVLRMPFKSVWCLRVMTAMSVWKPQVCRHAWNEASSLSPCGCLSSAALQLYFEALQYKDVYRFHWNTICVVNICLNSQCAY
jgi:hypothetical protein